MLFDVHPPLNEGGGAPQTPPLNEGGGPFQNPPTVRGGCLKARLKKTWNPQVLYLSTMVTNATRPLAQGLPSRIRVSEDLRPHHARTRPRAHVEQLQRDDGVEGGLPHYALTVPVTHTDGVVSDVVEVHAAARARRLVASSDLV